MKKKLESGILHEPQPFFKGAAMEKNLNQAKLKGIEMVWSSDEQVVEVKYKGQEMIIPQTNFKFMVVEPKAEKV